MLALRTGNEEVPIGCCETSSKRRVWTMILLGRGVRLWDGLEGLEKNYRVESVSSPSGVTHLTFARGR